MPQITCNGKIVDLIPSSFQFPPRCPICGGLVIRARIEDGETEGTALVCSNKEACPSQIRGRLEHWCSKQAMDIQDVGPVLISHLVAWGITKPYQLYEMTKEFLLTKIPGVAESKAVKTLKAIERSKQAGLERVLVGLGIPRVGTGTSKKLARAFKDITPLILTNVETLESINDLTKSAIESLQLWMAVPENQMLIAGLEKNGVSMVSKSYNPGLATGVFAGKSVVFTGGLSTMDRPKAQALVEQQGGRCPGSVSKKTDYLVVGDEPGSKLTKAQELGVQILTEEEFMKMINQE